MTIGRSSALLACVAALACGGESPTQQPGRPPSPSVDTVKGAVLLHPSMNVSASGEECLAVLGDEVFFRGESAAEGNELWRTDGTVGGTRLAVDIVPGAASSRPGCASVVGGRLFFLAMRPGGRWDYWLSDGTPSGTVPLDAGPVASFDFLSYRASAGGRLFFVSDDGVHGAELWVTDGTRAGTSMVDDIAPGPVGSVPFQLHAVGGRVFFTADDGVHGRELWTSDGTAAGTHLVEDVFPGGEDSRISVQGTTEELVFFTAVWRRVDTQYPTALFCAGPRQPVRRVLDGPASGGGAVNGRFVFLRADGVWASDGTPGGTAQLSTARVLGDTFSRAPAVAAGRLFFTGFDAEHGYEPWASDGTAQGARLVYDILPGPDSSFPYFITSLGDRVAFEARDGPFTTPWLSDGTAAGTRAAAPFGRMVSPRGFTRVGDRVYFVDVSRLWVLTDPLD